MRRKDLKDETSDIHKKEDVPPDSFVFCDKHGTAIESFKKSFAAFIEHAGLTFDTFGQRRTIYSLRHTYATTRIEAGVNHYALAQNMGTSVAMLEQYYGHTTNVGMVVFFAPCPRCSNRRFCRLRLLPTYRVGVAGSSSGRTRE